MRSACLLLSAALYALPAGAVRPVAKRPARKAPPAKASPIASPEHREAAPSVLPSTRLAAPPVSLDETALFGLGAALAPEDGAVLVAAMRPGSRADLAGIRAGDTLLSIDGAVSSRAEAAAHLRSWRPGTRLSLVVRRGLEIQTLETAAIAPASTGVRGSRDLSDHEKVLSADQWVLADKNGQAALTAAKPLSVPVPAGQSLWVRFAKGLPAGLQNGDEVSAEADTCVTADAALDFFAVPPGSRLRARVIETTSNGQTRTARLAFYALDLAGGGTYTTLGAVAEAMGDQSLARVNSAGILITPSPDAGKRAPMLDGNARLRVRLLEPLIIDEPPSYWHAGPGLGIKAIDVDGHRLFEITQAIEGRSAHKAGLKAGDRLDAIDGRSADKLSIADALERLYGAPGSEVEVSVLSSGKSQRFTLKRGMRWSGGAAAALPLPFEAR